MHVVAARLGYTAMALYDAILDAGMGLPPRPEEPRGDWRTEVTQWAHAKRAMLCARSWLADLPFVAAPHGPNWLKWVEAVVDPLSRTGLTGLDTGQMFSVIDGYTRGASDVSIALARARARGITGRGVRTRSGPRGSERTWGAPSATLDFRSWRRS